MLRDSSPKVQWQVSASNFNGKFCSRIAIASTVSILVGIYTKKFDNLGFAIIDYRLVETSALLCKILLIIQLLFINKQR